MNKVFTDGLSFALPLLIMAIGALYSEKSGVTNLAVEGFQGVGAFFGALAATLLSPVMGSGNQLIIYLAIICAAIGGALFSCIHGLLCIRFRANQVISGVVINILSVALTVFFTSAANTAINGNASNKFV
ncbi:MAG: ABC transporter permease, partial [Eubacteriales bacterium]